MLASIPGRQDSGVFMFPNSYKEVRLVIVGGVVLGHPAATTDHSFVYRRRGQRKLITPISFKGYSATHRVV